MLHFHSTIIPFPHNCFFIILNIIYNDWLQSAGLAVLGALFWVSSYFIFYFVLYHQPDDYLCPVNAGINIITSMFTCYNYV